MHHSAIVAALVFAAPNFLGLPGSVPPSTPPGGPAPSGEAAGAADATARRGVVQVEQGGRPLAIGTVLSKDGRIITSLSGIGNVEQPDVRYADGTVVKTKVGHRDKAWDLVLLIPQSGRWLEGLMPTDTDPQSVELKAFLPKAGKLAAAGIAVKGRVDARSRDWDPLRSGLDLDLRGSPSVPGAPVIEPGGRVVGILVRACKEAAGGAPPAAAGAAGQSPAHPPCSLVTIGAPVYALRGFLLKTPAAAAMPSPWLGLGTTPSEGGNVRGVRVVGVAPGSPAEKAGFKAAADAPDTIVALDGQPVETPEQLAEAIGKRGIGQQIKLLVYSGGKFREVPVTLRAAP